MKTGRGSAPGRSGATAPLKEMALAGGVQGQAKFTFLKEASPELCELAAVEQAEVRRKCFHFKKTFRKLRS